MSRFVTPGSTTLTLTHGDWVRVRNRLNHGEQLAAYRRLYTVEGGERVLDPLKYPDALIAAYVLDWSFTDDTGAVFAIRDQPVETLLAALHHLDPVDFVELREAIEAHEARQADARTKKKRRTGASTSAATSPSPFAVTGATSGSAH